MLRMCRPSCSRPRSTRPKRRQDAIEPESERRPDTPGVVVVESGRAGHLDLEAALVTGIFGAVARAPIVGVVGGGSRPDERETIGVVMGVQQVGQLLGGLSGADLTDDAEYDEAVEPG